MLEAPVLGEESQNRCLAQRWCPTTVFGHSSHLLLAMDNAVWIDQDQASLNI